MNTSRKQRLFLSLLSVCAFFLFLPTLIVPTAQAAPAGFVSPCGALFCLNGRVFNVAGTNNHYLGWGSHTEVDQVLNDAKALNLNVVRTIMHSVRGSLDSTQVNQGKIPLKWNWGSTADSSNMGMKGVYILYWNTSTNKMAWNDSTTDGLGRWDYVIWKAQQLGLKLDIALLDFWQWAGGVQQINANFKGGNYDTSHASDRYTFFFSDSHTKQFYKEWVNHVLNRTNTLTGVKYKDDPTIFAWGLMNEPEIGNTSLGQSWISEMSAYVKSTDPNHMVASGNEGFSDGHAGSNPQMEMKIATIDFATWHTYPTYHGISTTDVVNLINTNCQIAASGRKPVILQEFGYPSNGSNQSGVYQTWINAVYNNSNCAGWVFWRLVAREDNGQYPPDNGEHFDVMNNNSSVAQVFKNGAAQLVARNGTPNPTSTPLPGKTPTNRPIPTSTVVPTSTPLPTLAPTRTPAPTSTRAGVPKEAFIKGVNFNGNAVTILGNNWLSYSSARGQGLSVTGAQPVSSSSAPSPSTDAATTTMLNSALYATIDQGLVNLTQVIPNGTYHIYVWTIESLSSNKRHWSIGIEGVPLATALGDLSLNQWRRYGPYTATVQDGVLNISIIGVYGRSLVSGMEIYSFK